MYIQHNNCYQNRLEQFLVNKTIFGGMGFVARIESDADFQNNFSRSIGFATKVHVWYEYGLDGFIDLDARAGHRQKCSKNHFFCFRGQILDISNSKSIIYIHYSVSTIKLAEIYYLYNLSVFHISQMVEVCKRDQCNKTKTTV